MLVAVLLVLREVLEAALFVSLLLALCRTLGLGLRWALVSVVLGVLFSLALSRFAGDIANAWEGTGQEWVNSGLYFSAISCLFGLQWLMVPRIMQPQRALPVATIYFLCAAVVSCSLAREGTEVWIYLSSFTGDRQALASALVGSVIGTGIGLSLGYLVYSLFSAVRPRYFLPAFLVLTSVIAGGLAMQMCEQLMQIGWLDGGMPVWDTDWLINERSWIGQLLHALFGYDANPDRTQALGYSSVLLAMAAACALQAVRYRHAEHE